MREAAHSSVTWVPISRGDALPPGAVLGGTTSQDGQLYVGRCNGEAGKINLSSTASTMWNFRAHNLTHSYKAEILVCTANVSWEPIRKGSSIPKNAVQTGTTPTDGPGFVCVGRLHGEVGKISTQDNAMTHFYSHHQGKAESAEILVVPPVAQAVVMPLAAGGSSNGAARAQVVETNAVVESSASPSPPARERMPATPNAFADLGNLPEAELQHLCANESALDDWILRLPQVSSYADRVKQLREDNREDATCLLLQEADYESIASQHRQSQSALQQQRDATLALAAKRDEIAKRLDPKRMGAELATRAQRADSDAEDSLQEALSAPGVMDAGAFSKFRETFTKQKQEKHWRLAMRDSLES